MKSQTFESSTGSVAVDVDFFWSALEALQAGIQVEGFCLYQDPKGLPTIALSFKDGTCYPLKRPETRNIEQ